MSIQPLLFLLLFIFSLTTIRAQESYNALSWKMPTAFNAYLLRVVHRQYADRQEELNRALSSPKEMIRYQQECKSRYLRLLGSLPAKTPLQARVTGTVQQKGFRVEKVIFESVPGRHVTVNLYIPAGKGPFPAVLMLCGHGLNGKVSEQRAAIPFALNGFVVLVVDPVAQGERLQLTDSSGRPLTRGATTEHTLLNAGANLVGTSVAACEYWDNMRALDYLETRAEVDKNRVGCIGSSGGGTQTAYLVAGDERIKVAVVCSYVSRRERVLELNGASDGCQHLPYEGRAHLEIADFLILFAPKPLLIMSGYYDFVDYWGALQTFSELKKVYGVLKENRKVGMFSLEGGHGMPRPKREAAITWFRTWMYNDSTPVKEPETPVLTDKDLVCTETGQINTAFANEGNLPQYHYSLSRHYAAQRAAFLKQDSAAITAKIIELLGLISSKEKISAEATGSVPQRTYHLYKYQVIRKGELPVPCLVLYPETPNPSGQVVLYLNENGKAEMAANENFINGYMNRGDILVLADLRGFGETSDPPELNDAKYWNREYRNAMNGLHIGQPLMGQRVTDVFSLLDFISSEPKMKDRKLKMVANGLYGPVAIHAAWLDRRIGETEIFRSVRSFEELLLHPMQKDVYSHVLYGVLQYYDLKDLMNKLGGDRIKFSD